MSTKIRAAETDSRDGGTLSRWHIPALFLAGRLILLLNLPQEGLVGYGDHWNFFRLAGLGRPFVDFWVEFPPLFPHLSQVLYFLASGREHTYQYLLAILLTLCQAGSLFVFLQLAESWRGAARARNSGWAYALLLVGLGYGWWYFDPIAVFAMLLGIRWSLQGRDLRAGLALGVGVLTKWFPVLALAAFWRARPPRRALLATAMTLGLTAMVWGGLYLRAPEMTSASLASQASKGSWETVWALLDGNLETGNFSPDADRTRPEAAEVSTRQPARIPSLVTLAIFGAVGLAVLYPKQADDPYREISRLGVVWCLFLLWSPGYSPQWVLYLLPLVFLAIPGRKALLLAVTLLFVNLLEWPLLLSRGMFWALWGLIPLRTLLIVLLGAEFWRAWRAPGEVKRPSPEGIPDTSPPASTSGSVGQIS